MSQSCTQQDLSPLSILKKILGTQFQGPKTPDSNKNFFGAFSCAANSVPQFPSLQHIAKLQGGRGAPQAGSACSQGFDLHLSLNSYVKSLPSLLSFSFAPGPFAT